MPWVVSRWHLVLLKNCLPARYTKLSTVHAALDASRWASITPWLVVIVMVARPLVGMPVVGGVPTSLMLVLPDAGWGVQAHALASVVVFFLPENRWENPPLVQISPAATRMTTRPAPMPPWSCRRRRAAAARRAIWRSILARARARCRFLLGGTGVPLPGLPSISFGWHQACGAA